MNPLTPRETERQNIPNKIHPRKKKVKQCVFIRLYNLRVITKYM